MINIAEILKDCPKGTKLYSPICGECEFSKIAYDDDHIEVIACDKSHRFFSFYDDGRYIQDIGECLLFPSKDNRDWGTFNKPKLKIGDFIVSNLDSIGIVNGIRQDSSVDCFVIMRRNEHEPLMIKSRPEYICNMRFSRFATEEEKQQILDALDKNGYVWDAEKLKLRKKEHQFLPFEKVLVRDLEDEIWQNNFFGCKNPNDNTVFRCINGEWNYCIPYEGNEHLLGATNNPE